MPPPGNPPVMVSSSRSVVPAAAGLIVRARSGRSSASVCSTPEMAPSSMAIPTNNETTLFVTDSVSQWSVELASR